MLLKACNVALVKLCMRKDVEALIMKNAAFKYIILFYVLMPYLMTRNCTLYKIQLNFR